jgi:hypothetical protein
MGTFGKHFLGMADGLALEDGSPGPDFTTPDVRLIAPVGRC